jgi:predicted transcriptional regulator
MFCWGWDEISWFALQPEEYRNQWLLYAHDWIKKTDPNDARNLALYLAKADGRGRHRFFELEMDQRLQSRRNLAGC